MTRPRDKVFIIHSCSDAVAALLLVFAVVLFAGLFGWFFVQGFGLIAAVMLGSLSFCALGVLFAVTSPVWGLLLSLIYMLAMIVFMPFYSLYTAFRQSHKAS